MHVSEIQIDQDCASQTKNALGNVKSIFSDVPQRQMENQLGSLN